MNSFASCKVPGGKVVRLELEFDTAITQAKITGDFFLHPEEHITLLEEVFVGIPVPILYEEFKEKLKSLIIRHNIFCVGITAEALAQLAKEATEKGVSKGAQA